VEFDVSAMIWLNTS